MAPAMRLLPLLLLLPSVALAAPWDGPRAMQDGAALDGPGWHLTPVPGQFTVTWAPGVEDQHSVSTPAPARLEVAGRTLIHERPLAAARHHTDLYRLDGPADPRAVARALLARPDVHVAGPLLQTGPGAWRAITDQLLVQVHDLAPVQRRAHELGLDWIGPRGLAPDQHRLRVPPHADLDPVEAAMLLRELPEVRWAQVDWIQPRQERFLPDDPRFPNQWHLDNTDDNAGIPDNDFDAPEVWDITVGDGVILAVLDSGVDLDHEDLFEDLLPGFDFVDNLEGGATTGSNHGTRVTGVAAAPNNDVGVVGVCMGCDILPGRVIGATDSAEAAAHDWAVEQGAWVINNSWGPTDGTGQTTPIAPVMATAFEAATVNGRGGLGTLIFWAAGNGNPADTCTMDGLVAHPISIGVGSSSNEGLWSSYSERCPELDLSSLSNGGTAGMNTTQIDGYTSNFGGTSAAAPGAAGAAALVLSQTPDLRWDDARELLRVTAIKIDEDGGAYDERGHSLSYGYGRINPWSALQGGLLLEHRNTVVGCSANLDAKVVLPLEPGLGSVAVTATSPEEVEVLTLQELAPGIYEGTVTLTQDEVVAEDGIVSVGSGGVVTVESWDTGHTFEVVANCDAPILLEPQVTVQSPWAARISFGTFDDATGAAEWDGGDGGSQLGTFHRIWALGLEPCTAYTATISARDPLGNLTIEEDALSWTTPGDLGLLPDDPPTDADPCDPDTWGDDDDTVPWEDDDDSVDTVRRPGGDFTASGRCACDGLNGAFLLPLFLLRRRR